MWPWDNNYVYPKYDKYELDKNIYSVPLGKDFENNKLDKLDKKYKIDDLSEILKEFRNLKTSISVNIRTHGSKIIIDSEEVDMEDFEKIGQLVYKALAKRALSE